MGVGHGMISGERHGGVGHGIEIVSLNEIITTKKVDLKKTTEKPKTKKIIKKLNRIKK